MNVVLDARYAETLQRLALGVEPRDALRNARVLHPLQVALENGPPGARLERHASALFALRWQAGQTASLDYRLDDPTRRYVPRRLRVPVLTAADFAADPMHTPLFASRPGLFPGAAYDLSPTATGLRGRVLRAGQPLRWARITVTRPAGTAVLARAHGDDRGDFVLLLPASVRSGELVESMSLRVHVFGPAAAPVPADPGVTADPLWDLPVEPVPLPPATDEVTPGLALPPGYVELLAQNVDFPLGRMRSTPAFLIP